MSRLQGFVRKASPESVHPVVNRIYIPGRIDESRKALPEAFLLVSTLPVSSLSAMGYKLLTLHRPRWRQNRPVFCIALPMS